MIKISCRFHAFHKWKINLHLCSDGVGLCVMGVCDVRGVHVMGVYDVRGVHVMGVCVCVCDLYLTSQWIQRSYAFGEPG